LISLENKCNRKSKGDNGMLEGYFTSGKMIVNLKWVIYVEEM